MNDKLKKAHKKLTVTVEKEFYAAFYCKKCDDVTIYCKNKLEVNDGLIADNFVRCDTLETMESGKRIVCPLCSGPVKKVNQVEGEILTGKQDGKFIGKKHKPIV